MRIRLSLYRFFLIVFLSILILLPSFLEGKEKKLTYEQVYLKGEPRLTQSLPDTVGWLDDSYYLLMTGRESIRNKKRQPKLYKVSAKTGEKILFLDFNEIQKNLPKDVRASSYSEASDDYTRLVYYHDNDIFVFLTENQQFKRLTNTKCEEKNPHLSPDSRSVAFTRNHDLYTVDIETTQEYRLTSDGSETIYNGWSSWVYYEEILGRRTRFRAFWWSPDSKKLAFLRFDDSPVPTFPLFRSGGAHGELEITRYPKSGDPNPYVKLGVVSIPEGKIVWADVEEKADHYVAWPIWPPDSSSLTFQWMNREQNHIKIYGMDLKTGAKSLIYEETQPEWVEFFEDLRFFKDGSGFLLRSDIDGWRHLYLYDLKGNLIKQLTKGEWSVSSISCLDEKEKKVYFTAKKGSSAENHLFVTGLRGEGFKRLTEESGTHHVQVSPGGSFFLDTFSSVTVPTVKNLYRGSGKPVRELGHQMKPESQEYNFGRKELFTIPTEDGWNLPAYWILPSDFDKNKKYPVLFRIYSGPGSSSVSNSFPRLSDFYFAQEGIIIFSVDHRGSGHFGKKGMSLMHRSLGKWEMNDLIQAAKWLRQKSFVDSKKIGIAGGSYGGYTTCMALTFGADFFTHGYASSSVTDWKLYDTVYTERYMDRPSENKDGYEFGSVMTHADKLKGVLIMVHGDMDDNVHMQNTVQLISRFMDLGKQFQYMVYPDQRHGFRGKKREHATRQSVNFWFKHFLNR